jgi:tetratricopeptide (TPR) repeat protein
VSEEIESGAADSGDPVAISLALGGASREKADAFLDEQRHHLKEQFKQLRLALWEKRMGVFLRVATAVVGIAVATGAGAMVWGAAHSNGLVIEPFSVPADMVGRGLTGQVIASQMIDKLTEMTTHESSRAVQSYANNWGDNIKVEIPETGVSIGELQSFLKEWLGHDIHISGEIYRTATGISVTARTGGDAGATFTGAEADLDKLVQEAAEHVYEVTQPYRYANYLDRNYDPNGLADRISRATAIYRKLIAGDDPLERAWAWNGLGTIAFRIDNNNRQSAGYYRKALASSPDFTIGYYALSARNGPLGQDEESLASLRQAVRLLHRSSIPDLNPQYAINARFSADGHLAQLTGDYRAATSFLKAGAELPNEYSVLSRSDFLNEVLIAMARQHDLGAFHAYLRDMGLSLPAYPEARLAGDAEREDWQDTLAYEAIARKGLPGGNGTPPGLGTFDRYRPAFALAHAELGDFAQAEMLIGPVAPDNDGGLRARAQIAELQGQHARADWWFARAVAEAPSVPFAYTDWGHALLARGDANGAIAKFAIANQKGPHFADTLEGWGEALMAKKDSGAAAKFEEANTYAPNWGRLHLKWGEALASARKKDEAQKQFTLAGQLDLVSADKAELAQVSVHG